MAGVVLIRQRPGTSKGVVFITIEDETGIANLVVWPAVFEKQRKIVMGARLMAVHGVIQRDPDSEVIHVVAGGLEDHTPPAQPPQRRFAAPLEARKADTPGSWGRAAQAATRATSRSSPRAAISTMSRVHRERKLSARFLAANQR